MLMVLTRKYAREMCLLWRTGEQHQSTHRLRLVHLIKQIKRTVRIRHVRVTFDVVICAMVRYMHSPADPSTLTQTRFDTKEVQKKLNVTIVWHTMPDRHKNR